MSTPENTGSGKTKPKQKHIACTPEVYQEIREIKKKLDKERNYHVSYSITLNELLSGYRLLKRAGEETIKEAIREKEKEEEKEKEKEKEKDKENESKKD